MMKQAMAGKEMHEEYIMIRKLGSDYIVKVKNVF